MGLHNHQVVDQIGGEEVHFDAVSTRVHGRNLCTVQGGLDVAVAQPSHEHKIADRAHTWHAFDGTCRIAVARLFDLLARDEVHAGCALFLDVLHVDVPRTVHLGNHLCRLFDDVGFHEQVEIDKDDTFANRDAFGDRGVANEGTRHFVRPRSQALKAVVAIEVGHGPFVRFLDDDIRTNEGFPRLRVGHFAPNDSLAQKVGGGQNQGKRGNKSHHALKFFAKVFGGEGEIVNAVLRIHLTFRGPRFHKVRKKESRARPGFPLQ